MPKVLHKLGKKRLLKMLASECNQSNTAWFQYSKRLVKNYINTKGESTNDFRKNDDISMGFSDSEPYFAYSHFTNHIYLLAKLYLTVLPYFRLMMLRQKKLSKNLLETAQKFQMHVAEQSPKLKQIISNFKLNPLDTMVASPEKVLAIDENTYSYIYIEKFRLLQPLLEMQIKFDITVEIGSGCGFMAHLLCKHIQPNTLVLIDHLGPNIYAHDYLNQIKSLDYSIHFQTDDQLNLDPNSKQIIIMTPRQLNLLTTIRPKLVTNFTSLCLMEDFERKRYIELINNHWNEATLQLGHAGPWNDPLTKISLKELSKSINRPILKREKLTNLTGNNDGGSEYLLF